MIKLEREDPYTIRVRSSCEDGTDLGAFSAPSHVVDAFMQMQEEARLYRVDGLTAAAGIPADKAEQPKLVVTKDGVPFEDQAEGVRQFKEACRKAVDLTHISDDQLKQLWLSEQLPATVYDSELYRRRRAFMGATVVDPDKTNDDFKEALYRQIEELPTRFEWGVVRQLLMRIVSKL